MSPSVLLCPRPSFCVPRPSSCVSRCPSMSSRCPYRHFEGTGKHGEGTVRAREGTGGHGRGAGWSLALFRDVFGLHGPYTHALGHGEGTEKHGRARGGHGGVTGGHGGVREGAGGCGRGWGCSHAFFAIEFGSNGPEIPHFRHFRPAIWVPLARNGHLGPRNGFCTISLVGGGTGH